MCGFGVCICNYYKEILSTLNLFWLEICKRQLALQQALLNPINYGTQDILGLGLWRNWRMSCFIKLNGIQQVNSLHISQVKDYLNWGGGGGRLTPPAKSATASRPPQIATRLVMNFFLSSAVRMMLIPRLRIIGPSVARSRKSFVLARRLSRNLAQNHAFCINVLAKRILWKLQYSIKCTKTVFNLSLGPFVNFHILKLIKQITKYKKIMKNNEIQGNKNNKIHLYKTKTIHSNKLGPDLTMLNIFYNASKKLVCQQIGLHKGGMTHLPALQGPIA